MGVGSGLVHASRGLHSFIIKVLTVANAVWVRKICLGERYIALEDK